MLRRFIGVFSIVCALSSAFSSSQPVNLIWQIEGLDTSPEKFYEQDWIRELLAEEQVNEIVDGKCEVFRDNAIVICQGEEELEAYFAKLHDMNYHVGAIIISDENYSSSTSFYHHCKFVLRNYWHKKFALQKTAVNVTRLSYNRRMARGQNLLSSTKVKAFPLGYKQGFWRNCPNPDIKEVSRRSYTWSFAGQITKTTRMAMASSMKRIPNYFVHEVASFNGPDSLKVEDYRNLLLETIFVPCPRGFWNLDSFRVSEALECGCIPIVERFPFDYFEKLMGKYPFLSVSSWDEAPLLIQKLLEDPVQLEALRSECHRWWLEYKKALKQEIGELINESFFSSDE